jgi:hypothetical protein
VVRIWPAEAGVNHLDVIASVAHFGRPLSVHENKTGLSIQFADAEGSTKAASDEFFEVEGIVGKRGSGPNTSYMVKYRCYSGMLFKAN